jgi:hypothetical protein
MPYSTAIDQRHGTLRVEVSNGVETLIKHEFGGKLKNAC